MAITIFSRKQTPEGEPMPDILAMNINMETVTAKHALNIGLLAAKQQAQHKATRLARFGTPLLLAVILVSFVHIWESVSVYKPGYVEDLVLAPWLHYTTAAAFTAAIDAVAFYVIACSNAAKLAGATEQIGRWAMRFFLGLTYMLNAAFVIRHAPSLPSGFTAAALPFLDMFNVFALPAFIPVSIMAVEKAAHVAETAKLKLLIDTTVLQEMIASGKTTGKALGSISGSSTAERETLTASNQEPNTPAIGGRRSTATLEDLLTAIDNRETISRSDAADLLDCGRTKVDELLGEAVEVGKLEKIGRGIYKKVVS